MNRLTRRTLSAGLVLALFGVAGCNPPSETSTNVSGNSPAANSPAQPATALSGKIPVVMETSMGTIELELDADKAPLSTANFVQYAKDGFYDGTIFHRVIPDFMIQGGGFTEDLKEKPTRDPIKNEASNGLSNTRGTIAMARTSDPDSATSQFFINVADNSGKLDPSTEPGRDPNGYAVFGQVTKGMDVVDKIKAVPTGSKQATALQDGNEVLTSFDDVPNEAVVIKSVKVLEPGASSEDASGANSPAAGNAPAGSTGNTPAPGAPASGH